MGVEIQPYAEAMVPAVRAFNGRLRQAGISWQFPETHVSSTFPRSEGASVYQEHYLALEGEAVRGGYILKHQMFSFHGKTVPGAFCRLPMSEGIINRRYGLVGVQVVRDALKKRSVLFSTGMGGADSPYAKLLRSLGWGLYPVPFLFKVNHPFRFLRGIDYLRKSPPRRLALDLAAFSGAGWLGLKLLQRARQRATASGTEGFEVVDGFSDWADELWHDCRESYSMLTVRDAEVLTALYPEDDARFIRLRVTDGKQVVGWAVVLDTQMTGHKQFGALRVGSIADTLARPEHAGQVTRAATRFLEERDVDLIVTNQCHRAWCEATQGCGYLSGPSNFVLAASKDAVSLLQPFETERHNIHLNRGDGDGPMNL